MQSNRQYHHIPYSTPRTIEKQRFSINGSATHSQIIPIYTNQQEKYQSHDYLSAFGAIIRNAQRRIWHRFQGHQRTHLTSHSKDPSPPTSPSSHSTFTFIFLCTLWYSSSALSSNTGKAILNQFRYPVTLTFVQFGFVASYCLLLMSPVIRFSKLRAPSKAILQNTLPMGMFQVGGHMFSSMAISRIPVSTVHTIKALSPLFTVAAYAVLFKVSYSTKTYVSLLPLMVGVMLACSFDVSASSVLGLLCAFGSALVFVSSNIFFKKIMPSNTASTSHKLDKLNLLFYSSGMAFLLMIPIWIYYDMPILLAGSFHPEFGLPKNTFHSVTYYFFVNGTVHFGQNIIAFIILSSTSPVTYSIASLIKRVVVICIAIVWFQQSIHPIQGMGILMTFVGLYMYNQSKADVEKGEQKMRRVEAARGLVLPITKEDGQLISGNGLPPPSLDLKYQNDTVAETSGMGLAPTSAYERAKVSASAYHPSFTNSYQKLHPTSAGLKVETTPPSHKPWSPTQESKHMALLVDSYPSPPPSIDSPPSRTVSLEEIGQQAVTPVVVY